MDSCFDKGYGEAVRYENGDEPVQPAMSGNDDGQEVEVWSPLRNGLPNRDPTLTLTFCSRCVCVVSRKGTVAGV